jgi:hypothetical protein
MRETAARTRASRSALDAFIARPLAQKWTERLPTPKMLAN